LGRAGWKLSCTHPQSSEKIATALFIPRTIDTNDYSFDSDRTSLASPTPRALRSVTNDQGKMMNAVVSKE
jgi:hypothetical protein